MTDAWPAGSVDVVVTEIVERPSAVVAAYMTDPARAPEWYANIAAVAWKAPLPLQVGTEGAFVARFLGRELRYTYEVIEDTPVSLVMRTAQGPFPMETSYRYEPLADGSTAVTLRNRGTPQGFSWFVAPFVRIAMRRAATRNLAALKRILEDA